MMSSCCGVLSPFYPRRVLFLDDSVLEHSIGPGYASHTRSRDQRSRYHLAMHEAHLSSASMVDEGSHERTDRTSEHPSTGMEVVTASENTCSPADVRLEKSDSEQPLQSEGEQCASSSSATIPCSTGMERPITFADLAKLRAEVAETVAKGSGGGSQESRCSSLFVLPQEWMAPLLVGHREGKVRRYFQLISFGYTQFNTWQ